MLKHSKKHDLKFHAFILILNLFLLVLITFYAIL